MAVNPPSGEIPQSAERIVPKCRVLYVDDDQNLRELIPLTIHRVASDSVEVVEVAEDGPNALEKYEKMKPDVIITDFNMPGMTGLEFAKEITKRRRENGDVEPFNMVLLTGGYGKHLTPTKDELKEAGFNFVLSKPVLGQTIADTFKTIRERR